jgi:hypothetical protein
MMLALPHPYIGASGACWQAYGTLLAQEFSDPLYFFIIGLRLTPIVLST